MKRGGYDRLVVVVVVTVFVSTHSATSNWSRAARPATLLSSSHLTDTCWLDLPPSEIFWTAGCELMMQ